MRWTRPRDHRGAIGLTPSGLWACRVGFVVLLLTLPPVSVKAAGCHVAQRPQQHLEFAVPGWGSNPSADPTSHSLGFLQVVDLSLITVQREPLRLDRTPCDSQPPQSSGTADPGAASCAAMTDEPPPPSPRSGGRVPVPSTTASPSHRGFPPDRPPRAQ